MQEVPVNDIEDPDLSSWKSFKRRLAARDDHEPDDERVVLDAQRRADRTALGHCRSRCDEPEEVPGVTR